MIINHQVTTLPENASRILEGDAYRKMRAARDECPVALQLEHLACDAESAEHWISRGQDLRPGSLDKIRAEYTKLVEDNISELMELIRLGYVLPWSPPKVEELLAEAEKALEAQIEAEEHAERVAAYDELVLGIDPLAPPHPALPDCDGTRLTDKPWQLGSGDWSVPCEATATVVVSTRVSEAGQLEGDWPVTIPEDGTLNLCEPCAELVRETAGPGYVRLVEELAPYQDPTSDELFGVYKNNADYLKALADYETKVAGPERRVQERKELQVLTQDPQWTEATKHLDAVAAFVAQGTHNPRAYARAQSRFVGSILKLTQNHMEDTISKAVEDRFALLSHDGIEDTQVLSNRFELLRDAVNEVFQYPDLNDVVGRDTVGL